MQESEKLCSVHIKDKEQRSKSSNVCGRRKGFFSTSKKDNLDKLERSYLKKVLSFMNWNQNILFSKVEKILKGSLDLIPSPWI